MNTVRARADVPRQYTFDAESIFETAEDWEDALLRVVEMLPGLASFEGRLAEGPQMLAQFIEDQIEAARTLGKVGLYARLLYAVDTSDSIAKARSDRAGAVLARFLATTAFAEPEMLSIGFDTLREWLPQDERLAPYGHYLDDLERRQSHVRSAEVEEVLGMVVEPFSAATATHGILTDSELPFPPARSSSGEEYPVTQGTLGALTSDPDRTLRRTAWESYADTHLAFKNTMASVLSAGIKRDVFIARSRRYSDSLEAALAPNNIPTAVFHNLIDTFQRNLPTWHRYWKVRRAALGYDELYPWDIKAPLAQQKPEVPYEQAVQMIVEGLGPMGQEYVDIVRRGATEERWVDVYPNRGKRMGAFSSGTPGTHPFIVMSYHDDLYSLSTLAHELGHSLHSYYTWQNQPHVYSRYSMFVAETASNFHQALVRAALQGKGDRDFQITLLEEAMSNFHRYFFIMPTLARFELEIHQRVERGEALTASTLIDLMADLFEEGYGGEVVFNREQEGITWAEFSTHLYANFYVFQYATGISAANALARGILDGEEGAVEKYLNFLKAGNSLYPVDALKLAGVDMTTPEPVDAAFDVLSGTVDRLAELLDVHVTA